MGLYTWQTKFILICAATVPLAPFLKLQGDLTRWKVGVLPEAAGPDGVTDGDGPPERMLAIGESTIAGLGARTHELGFAGNFARELSARTGRPIAWKAIGRNGVTARRTIDELLPLVGEGDFDRILLGIGGNDVLKLSTPIRWRRNMLELLERLRADSPRAEIYISNCPMLKYSPALPQPIRAILWEISKMHNANIKEFTRELPGVHYYPQPDEIDDPGFFADGLHPSEQGYADWAKAMAAYFFDQR